MKLLFPELYQADTMELPQIAALSAIAGAIIFPFSATFAVAILLPAFLVALYLVRIAIVNLLRRIRWAHQFDRRLSTKQAWQRFQSSPDRYVLYVQFYGRFDRERLTPAAVVRDLSNDEQFAVFPSTWRIVDRWRESGGRIYSCNLNHKPGLESEPKAK